MHFIVYKTTNKINGMVYIGKHQTKNLNDKYLGSGKYLLLAINKYGIENFQREILFVFDNETEMNAKEAELVTEQFVNEDTNYNLCPGGNGGFGYLNSTGLNTTGVKDYNDIARKVSATKNSRSYTVSEETRKKISDSNKLTNESRGRKNSEALRGKPKSEEHKRKISESLLGKGKGKKYPNRKKRQPVVFEIVYCPFCEKTGKLNAMKRWHFDNCKNKAPTDH